MKIIKGQRWLWYSALVEPQEDSKEFDETKEDVELPVMVFSRSSSKWVQSTYFWGHHSSNSMDNWTFLKGQDKPKD
jgi:hypothetical protein